ncbi:MAG: ARMT1-like domain-containing protein [Candidatus Margulisiibacteriota bacterium]
MSDSAFSSQFQSSYDYVSDLVAQRELSQDYSWLLNGSVNFVPDYFTIRTLGRNGVERFLNFGLSNRFGKFNLSYIAMKRFMGLFYDVICPELNDSYQWLSNRLIKAPSAMMDWTLVEFFLFMEHWLRSTLKDDRMLFFDTKMDLNRQAMDLVSSIELPRVNRLALLLNASCYANWLDVIVADFDCRKSQVFSYLKDMFHQGVWPVRDDVLKAFGESEFIVYECDNAGEVVFDLMVVLELIKCGKSVTMVAKSSPILNDITTDEIHDLVNSVSLFLPLKNALGREFLIISANDFPMVGKYLPKVTEDYRNAFLKADLVWLKGQANFQTMPRVHFHLKKYNYDYHPKVGVSFIAKAPIVQYCLRYSNIKKVAIGDALMTLI